MKWLGYSLAVVGGGAGLMLALAESLTDYRKDVSALIWIPWCFLVTGLVLLVVHEVRTSWSRKKS